MLTGNKDVDRMILNKLEDVDLVKACQVNKKAELLCNDQVFWMNRVFDKFGYVGGDILRANKGGDQSWSEYYINDLRKINKDTADIYLVNGSSKGRFDMVMIALKNGADVDSMSGQAPRLAAKHGHLDILKYLVQKGADINLHRDQVILSAILGGYLDVIKYLVSQGANLKIQSAFIMTISGENGKLDVIKYLKEQGLDIHNNEVVLRMAAKNGHLEIVRYLVEDGANIHENGDAALAWARYNNHLDVVEYLESL